MLHHIQYCNSASHKFLGLLTCVQARAPSDVGMVPVVLSASESSISVFAPQYLCSLVCMLAGAPSDVGVVPVVLAGAPTGAPGPARPATTTPPKGPPSGEVGESGDAGSSIVVVESSVANDGTRQEVLRSMCQVVNSTELALEVGVMQPCLQSVPWLSHLSTVVESSSSQMMAHARGCCAACARYCRIHGIVGLLP